jgi:hypothetical protein
VKVLQIVESAYRATLEEQDDTIIWLTHALRGAGADLTLILCGNAVTYAGIGQDASGLCFGEWKQTQPPQIAADIRGLIGKGVEVYAVEEDLAERGVAPKMRIPDITVVPRSDLARLFGAFDQVWHW